MNNNWIVATVYRLKKRLKRFYAHYYLVINTWYISKKIKRKGKKFLFIDCGSNLGQGFKFFKKYFETKFFDYILIEPNPNCIKVLRKFVNNNITLIEKGVWSHETTLKFYGINESSDIVTSGGSLIKNHNSLWYTADEKKSLEIETISLSKLIMDKKNEYDTIVLKMDIESSEFVVLPSLIDSNAINLISHIFIEFHTKFFDTEDQPKYEELEKQIKEQLKSKKVGLTNWE